MTFGLCVRVLDGRYCAVLSVALAGRSYTSMKMYRQIGVLGALLARRSWGDLQAAQVRVHALRICGNTPPRTHLSHLYLNGYPVYPTSTTPHFLLTRATRSTLHCGQVAFAWLAIPAAVSTALVVYAQGKLALRIRSHVTKEVLGTFRR